MKRPKMGAAVERAGRSRDRHERQSAHRRSARDHRHDLAGGAEAVLRRSGSAHRYPRRDRGGDAGRRRRDRRQRPRGLPDPRHDRRSTSTIAKRPQRRRSCASHSHWPSSRASADGTEIGDANGRSRDDRQPACRTGRAVRRDPRRNPRRPRVRARCAARRRRRGDGRPRARHPDAQIVVDDTRHGIGKLAHAHRARWTGKLVAITGSAGKTTTKELVRSALAMAGTTHAADGSLNNETGVPLTLLCAARLSSLRRRRDGHARQRSDRVPDADRRARRRGGRQRRHRAHRAARLDRCDRRGEVRDLARPARRRHDRAARRGRARSRNGRASISRARVTSRSAKADADVTLVRYEPVDDGGIVRIDVFGELRELRLGFVGRHVAIDACCALAAAHAAGASVDQALAGLSPRAAAVDARRDRDARRPHVIVDCYNANPASMAAAMTHARRAREACASPSSATCSSSATTRAPRIARSARSRSSSASHVIALGEQAKLVARGCGRRNRRLARRCREARARRDAATGFC